jgi:hypothetical protein
MEEPKDGRSSAEKSKLPLYISLALIGGLIAVYFFIPQGETFFNRAWAVLTSDDEERIKSWVTVSDGSGRFS